MTASNTRQRTVSTRSLKPRAKLAKVKELKNTTAMGKATGGQAASAAAAFKDKQSYTLFTC